MNLDQYQAWLGRLQGQQQRIELAGVRAGSNAANAGRQRNQRVYMGSNTVTVVGGRSVASKRITDAMERGVREELDRALK